MNTRTEEFVVRLNTDCRRRHTHSHYKGKVVSFSVQLEVRFKNNWHPGGKIDKTPLFLQDYNESLIFAEEDIKNNWELYREKFITEAQND